MKDKSFWTSETQMFYERDQIIKAEGCYIWDLNGKKYLDFNSGTWNVILGHGRSEFKDALISQLNDFEYIPNVRFFHKCGIDLAESLLKILPSKFSHVYFTSGGAEAVETSIKLARQYWYNKGEKGRTRFISLYESYHGSTLAAMSLSGDPWSRIPFDPLLKGFLHIYPQYCYKCRLGLEKNNCDYACLADFRYQIAFYGAENICALIIEPVMGVGGVIIPDKKYLTEIVKICHENGIIVIFDEVTTGLGRTGNYFACQEYEIYPDIILFGKSISNGTQPLAGVIVTAEIFNAFLSPEIAVQFRHGFTNSGHPLTCSAGKTVLEIFEKENIISMCRTKEQLLKAKLDELKNKPYVGEIRIKGLMIAIELINPNTKKELVIDSLDIKLKEAGLIVSQMRQVICLMPPVIITESEINSAFEIIIYIIEKAINSRDVQ
jgi:adenosylmethionine-8-amino-7-oxononanoate aminotransferase